MTNCMKNFISYPEKWMIDLLFKNNQTRDKLQSTVPLRTIAEAATECVL